MIPGHVFRFVEAELGFIPKYRRTLEAYQKERVRVVEQAKGRADWDRGENIFRLTLLERRTGRARAVVQLFEGMWEHVLSDEQRELVDLKYVQGLTNAEVIARMGGLSRTSWYRLRRAVVREFADAMGLI